MKDPTDTLALSTAHLRQADSVIAGQRAVVSRMHDFGGDVADAQLTLALLLNIESQMLTDHRKLVSDMKAFIAKQEDTPMADPRLNVGVASNDRRMFEITLPNIGKIVCEASTKLTGVTAGREEERKAQAKLNGKQLSEALTKAIQAY